MKYARLLLLAALLLCLTVCAQADGTGTGIQGTADQAVEFYVYASRSATLTFSQNKGTVKRSTGGRSSIYGGFDITWYPTGQTYSAQTAAMDKASASIRLNSGYYTVRVTPYAMDRLKSRDSYLGYPGTYTGWQTPAKWSLTGADGCRVSTTPLYGSSYATATPYYGGYYPYATATPYYGGYYSYATATPYYGGYYSYATATPKPDVKAKIYVYYRLTDGSLITYKTKELAPGTHYITNDLNGSYFTLVGMPYQTVTVYDNGQASAGSVTFYFKYNSSVNPATARPTATPTPAPTAAPRSAAVRVYYKLLNGALLSYETRVLYTGQHQIAYDYRYAGVPGLTFVGPAVYQVVVYGNGTASVSDLTFYFNQLTVATPTPTPYYFYTSTPAPYSLINEAATNQTAIIGAQKIFPRPMPGKGKNTFNYEAAGQAVTVHSKAKSLQNDNTWWVCFSATLKCGGEVYEIDHEWIRVDYLNKNSFNLDAVPVNPQYQ